MNIYKINLNLLVAFEVLMTERHVSRASQTLCISQSATSNALSRLRELFKDELLIRTPTGMEPTQRALELIQPVREVINQAQAVFQAAEPFDAKASMRCFKLGMSDYTALVLLPFLRDYLGAHAPNATLQVKTLNALNSSERLDSDEVELAVGFFGEAPEKLYRKLLFKETGVFVGCKNNALMKKPLTQEKLFKAKHIALQYNELAARYLVDEYLVMKGYPARQVVLSVPHTILALLLLPNTNFLTLTGEKLVHAYEKILPIKYQPSPIELPQMEVHQVWHARYHNDPGHRWLREVIAKYCAKWSLG